MKKLTAILLVLVLLLAGCGTPAQTTDGTTMGTVPDPFTQPDLPTTTAAATTAPAPKYTLPDRDIPTYTGMGFQEKDMVYSGEPIRTQIMLTGTGYANVGLGLLLFVDGQPQPYCTGEDETVSYMHIFYPEDDVEYYHDLIFTPVSGKTGETVDVHMMAFKDPAFCLGDGEVGAHISCLSVVASITFEADPAAQTLPEVADALLSWSCVYEDSKITSSWTAEQLQQEIGYGFYINRERGRGIFFGVTAEDTFKVKLELWGMPYVGYGLAIYVDGKPVSTNAEDMMLFDIHNGQKTIVEAEFALAEFDGSSNVCVMLVPRNCRSCGVENQLELEDIGVSYLVAAGSYDELLKEINS